MRKLLIGLVVVVVALVAVVVVAPSFVDWNAYKGQLAGQVEAATGRSLTIDGDLSLSLLPTPRLSASGVRLGNVEGAAGADMIRLDTARVRIALGPLTQGRLEVDTVELIEPRIELERLADGRTNWSFAPAAGSGGETSSGRGADGGFSIPEVSFNNIRVRNGTLVYRDQASGLVEHVESVNATIVAGSLEGPFRAEGDLRARNLPLQMRLAVGRLIEGRAVPVSLVVGVGDETDTAEFSGVLSGFPNNARLNGSLAVRSENASALVTAFGDGAVPPGLADKPVVVEGDLAVSPVGLSLNDVSLRLADSSATGAVQLTFGDPPRVDVVLNVGQVDLDRLLAPETGAPEPQSPPSGTADVAPVIADRSRLAAFALPSDFAAGLEAKIDALVLNGGIVRQIQMSAELNDGQLTVNEASAQLPGGSDISLFGFVVPADGKPVFDGQLEANSDNLRALLTWLSVNVGDIPADRLRKFELAAKLKATPDELTVSGIDMQLDLSSIRGGIAVALRRRLGFGIGLSVDRINLDAYLPRAAAAPASEPATVTIEPAAPQQETVPVFGSATFLDSFDAILQLQIGSLTYDGAPISGIGFDGTLQGGELDLRRAAIADFAGAGITLNGRLAGLGQRPSADLEIAVDAGDTSRLVQALGLNVPIPLRAAKLDGTIAGDFNELRINARLLAADGEVKIKGNFAGLDGNPRFTVAVDAAHPSFNALIAALSDLPASAGDPGQLALTGSISGDLAAAELDLSTRLGEGAFTLRGRLADLLTAASGDLAAELSHPSLTTLARTFRPDYRPALAELGEFRLSADLNFDPESVKVTGLNGAVGPVALQGEADLAYRTDELPPRLTASLATSEIILEWFLAPVALAAGALDTDRADPPSRDGGRWSREPFDLSFLNSFEAEIDLSAPALSVASYGMGNPEIALRLEQGKFELNRFSGDLFGGILSATGDVVASDPPTLNLVLSVSGADAPQMIAAARAGKQQNSRTALSGVLELLFPVAALDLSAGTLGSDMAVGTTGRNEFELVSNLAGRGEVTFNDAVIDGTDLCRISDQLGNLNGLDGFLGLFAAGDGGETKVEDFIGRFDLERGVATLPNQDIRSECAIAAFGGTIDLPRWRTETRANVTFPKHPDFPGIVLEEKGALDAPDARLANINAIQQYLIAKAAENALRRLAPSPPPAPANTPAPQEQPVAEQPEPAPEAKTEEVPLKIDPFKSLLDTLTR